jgi:hypothetical protein
MKGIALRPQWPAPTNNKADPKAESSAKPDAMSRIKLALLDEYSGGAGRNGYNPYDTNAGERSDVWRRKPKRD